MTRIADYMDSTGVRAVAQESYQRLAPLAKSSARQAAGGARQAAAVVAPYASTARTKAAYYAGYYTGGARQRFGPKVSQAMKQARGAVPPKMEVALETAAKRSRTTMRNATETAVPMVTQAVGTARTAAEPVAEEAVARGAAAVAALRGKVTVKEIEKLARARARRERGGQAAKRFAVVSLVASGGYAAWKWWNQQTNPDWLVEEPEATGVDTGAASRTTFDSVDGTGPVAPDADLQTRQAEEGGEPGRGGGEPPA